MTALGIAKHQRYQAKRERRILKRLRAGKKAWHGPMTFALRLELRRR